VKSTFLEAVSSKTNPFGNCNSPPTAAPENIVDLDQTPEAVVLQIPRNIQTPIIKTADLSNVQSHAEDRSNPDTKHSPTRGASRCVSTFGTPIKPTYSNRNKRGGFRRHQNKAELIRPGPVCKTTIPGLVVKPIQTQAPFRGGYPYQQPNLNNVRQIPCPFNPMILAQDAFFGTALAAQPPLQPLQAQPFFPNPRQLTYPNITGHYLSNVEMQIPTAYYQKPPLNGLPIYQIPYSHAVPAQWRWQMPPTWMPPPVQGIPLRMY
jgi:hypothetical protein